VVARRAPRIGIIGGTGLHAFLDEPKVLHPHTPYGPPSGPITVGELSGQPVAFLPRHGPHHELPPHRINNRANLWALARLGVERVIGPCAAGSLRPDLSPGDLVVLDQLVDRTWGRIDTFLDGPEVGHISFADPYCPELSATVAAAAAEHAARQAAGDGPGWRVHPTGTVVVVQGPRFSTRAESVMYRALGFDVINMTQYPEAYLARELGLCYAGLALVTDRDTGIEGDGTGDAVTMEAILAVLDETVERARDVISSAVPTAATSRRRCGCRGAAAAPLRR
jgi:5'-methylthioadenosine phosphorylase